MRASSPILAVCAVALTALLAGCHEPVSVTMYTPGEYKGASDPLVKLAAKPEHKDALKKRFMTVQGRE